MGRTRLGERSGEVWEQAQPLVSPFLPCDATLPRPSGIIGRAQPRRHERARDGVHHVRFGRSMYHSRNSVQRPSASKRRTKMLSNSVFSVVPSGSK